MSAIPRYEFRSRFAPARADGPKVVTLKIDPWPRQDDHPQRWTVSTIPEGPVLKRGSRPRTATTDTHIVTARPGGAHTCSCDVNDDFTPCVHVLGIRAQRG